MRLYFAVKNSTYSLLSYVFLSILGIIVRKFFLQYFDIEYLGYEGLFGSTFTLLSMAEMGIAGMVTYRLYKAIEEQNYDEISLLMEMFKLLYRIIGVVVFFLGMILYLYLPLIIKDNVCNLGYVRIIFIVNLLITLSSYFLAYRRTLFIADQKEYFVVKIDTIYRLLGFVLKLYFVIFLQNYILYILTNLFTNIACNFTIFFLSKKKYSKLKKKTVRLSDYKERKFDKDIANLIIHKFASTIYSSADNVIISFVCGIKYVGLYSNYLLINAGVMSFFAKLLTPLEASVGNFIYKSDFNKLKDFFYGYDCFCKLVASYSFVSFFILFQPTISYLFGQNYLLPISAVFMISLNNYVSLRQYSICSFRDAVGNYEIDRNSRLYSAILNVVLSLLLGHYYGITGILFSTVIGNIFIWYGRQKVVEKNIFLPGFLKKNMLLEIKMLCISFIDLAICYYLTLSFSFDFIGLIERFVLCLFVTNGINLLFLKSDDGFFIMKDYMFKTLSYVRAKFLRK